jgi:hypothetical protein
MGFLSLGFGHLGSQSLTTSQNLASPLFSRLLSADLSTGTGTGAATFSRASSGTYIDVNGVLQTAASNVPRFDYNAQSNAGVLIEPQATNLLLWSQDATNAVWTKTNTTVTASVASPDAGTNAQKLTATAANGTTQQTVTLASQISVFSVWLKRVSGTGTVNITADGTTWTAVTPTNNWQRFSATRTAANPSPGVRIVTSGDAVSVFGAQFESGAATTSYIATTTSTATRAYDSLSYPTSGNIQASQGSASLWLRGALDFAAGGNRIVLDVGGTGPAGGFAFLSSASGTPGMPRIWVGTGTLATLDWAGTPMTAGVFNHLVANWSPTGVGISVNGQPIQTLACSPTIVLNASMFVGSQLTHNRFTDADIRNFVIYNAPLTQSQVAAIYAAGP